MLSRRSFVSAAAAAFLVGRTLSDAAEAPAEAARAVALAHAELWRRFVDRHDVLLDYTDAQGGAPIPTAQECQENKPNALGWWTPIENGAFFNGLYLGATCDRYKLRGRQLEDAQKARRIAKGLMFLASVGTTPGFIARGVAIDGESHFPLGSNDQTLPWFYGLWRYLKSDIPNGVERNKITDKMVEVASALEKSGWRMPADAAPFQFRGTFAPHTWEAAPRVLFLCQAMMDLTADEKWQRRYRQLLREPSKDDAPVTRLDVCAKGTVRHGPRPQSWTEAVSAAALRGLWELESDPDLSQAYETGLRQSALVAAESLPLYQKFDRADQSGFEGDWRKLNEWWKPQASEAEAVSVAEAQAKELAKMSPRRNREFLYVREPLFAAWIVSLCPDEKVVDAHREIIAAMLNHFPYDRLYYSQFFAGEMAAYRLGIVAA